MIVARIEEWPAGDEKERDELGRLEVGNVGGHEDDPSGDYLVILHEHGEIVCETTVIGHPRHRRWLELLRRATVAALDAVDPAPPTDVRRDGTITVDRTRDELNELRLRAEALDTTVSDVVRRALRLPGAGTDRTP